MLGEIFSMTMPMRRQEDPTLQKLQVMCSPEWTCEMGSRTTSIHNNHNSLSRIRTWISWIQLCSISIYINSCAFSVLLYSLSVIVSGYDLWFGASCQGGFRPLRVSSLCAFVTWRAIQMGNWNSMLFGNSTIFQSCCTWCTWSTNQTSVADAADFCSKLVGQKQSTIFPSKSSRSPRSSRVVLVSSVKKSSLAAYFGLQWGDMLMQLQDRSADAPWRVLCKAPKGPRSGWSGWSGWTWGAYQSDWISGWGIITVILDITTG